MAEPIYRFGKFELSSGELRADGRRVGLQEKPLLVLTALVESAQQVVTRQQLRQRMWPIGTFVDYEQGINVAIKKVRDSLGDTAEAPEYIETIAKKGYRFLLSVQIVESDQRSESPIPVTPDPRPVSVDEQRAHPTRSRWLPGMGIAAVLIAGVAGLGLLERRPHAAPQIKSIAVLPLQNLSADPEQDYFADGITDELITSLAQFRNLRVTSRTSTMRYKQTKEPLTKMARELGVDAIVEGSVRRSGNRVLITAQLIDAASDRHLWASSYERDLGDVLLLQMEISREISREVGATVGLQQAREAPKPRVVTPEVYDLCLLGRYHWNKRTEADLKKAIEYFQTATEGDPTYAPAFADLANSYAVLPFYSQVPFAETAPKAKAAANRALVLDETLAEAHATLAFISISMSPVIDWVTADREFRRALELNPSYATAHHWYAFYLQFAGEDQHAVAEAELARQLDPLSVVINADEGQFLYGAHRPEDAIARLQRAIELSPDFGQPHQTLALVYTQLGKMSDALAETRIALKLDPHNPATMAEAGYVLAEAGKREEAESLLAELGKGVRQGWAPPIQPAFIYVGLGETDQALDVLEKVCDPRTGAGPYGLAHYPLFDRFANNIRYQQLRARMQEMRSAKLAQGTSVAKALVN